MISRYTDGRGLRRYLAGAAAARAGDEMSGPALLLLGFAVTGRPGTGSGLLASLTIAGAAGGPMFGALLDRSRRPDRLLAWTLAAYALGIVAVQAAVGRLPMPALAAIALLAGLFNPAVTGGWTAQLPRVVTGRELDRGSALDALTFSAASLAGPALAAGVAAGIGARAAVLTAAALVALAVPSACSLSRYRPPAAMRAGQRRVALRRQMAAGFAVIVARRPLLRATVTSVVSYAGIGMLLVCCPLLGAQRLGDPARGALLISAIAVASLTANAILARRPRRMRPGQLRRDRPDTWVLASTLVIGVSMAAAALAPGWLTLAAVALGGAGEGPQLTALFAVRHRETPAQHARAGLHHGGQPEDRRAGGRGGARRAAGRVVGDRLPADRGGNRTVRRGRLPRGRVHPSGTAGARRRAAARPGRHGHERRQTGPFGIMSLAFAILGSCIV